MGWTDRFGHKLGTTVASDRPLGHNRVAIKQRRIAPDIPDRQGAWAFDPKVSTGAVGREVVIASVPDIVVIAIGLVEVRNSGTIVARIAHTIVVAVLLIWITDSRTVVLIVSHPIVVAIRFDVTCVSDPVTVTVLLKGIERQQAIIFIVWYGIDIKIVSA